MDSFRSALNLHYLCGNNENICNMGIFINKGNSGFRQTRKSEYIDKSGLIGVVNQTLFTRQKFTCVTRCRRFGKSMAAEMLSAYYDHSCDSRSLFTDLQIASNPSFEEHLNKYPVIYLDMTTFITSFGDEQIVAHIQEELIADIQKAYPQVVYEDGEHMMKYLQRINIETGEHFIFIIDEWDAICREFGSKPQVMDEYLNLLRRMFKDVSGMDVFAGVYMTGILPIKKFKTQSALNNFEEYSMVSPGDMAPFFGFTKEEVRMLSDKHGMDFDELEKWYDGYQIGPQPSMFNPNSVMQAIRKQWCDSYWSKTGATDAISGYINMNYDGLKDDIIRMIAGERCKVNPNGFKNDLSQVNNRDDVLTVLIHLGYLSYDRVKRECRIPNLEVLGEMENAINDVKWVHVGKALQESEQLLEDTLAGNAEAVARGVGAAHSENTSILSYNDENSMACVLSIAYYFAHGDYIFHREYASGKGYADLVLIPRKNVDSPAIVIELKYGHSADEAMAQIKERRYWEKVSDYSGDVLLVGISYDREAKTHECIIKSLSIDR
ncbi:MAG: AAA family ATPase [Bacteroidaceae bacterium]|nr:AAA family ATPase [Bacteroidaceae bacterium]